MSIPVTLSPVQRARLEARVAAGDFPSLTIAVQATLDAALVAALDLERDDVTWALPLIDEARRDAAAGRVLTLPEHGARMAAQLVERGA